VSFCVVCEERNESGVPRSSFCFHLNGAVFLGSKYRFSFEYNVSIIIETYGEQNNNDIARKLCAHFLVMSNTHTFEKEDIYTKGI